MNNSIILIPYIDQETGAAEVWIGRNRSALQALADFSGEDMRNMEAIHEHCAHWQADRILLPTDETLPRWTAYTIASVLAGRPQEVL